jgi:hypothetical protein
MKRRLACLLIILTLALSACADTSVSYRLSGDNSVTIDYRMEISPDGKDISSYTSMITYYWEALGFTTDMAESDDTTTLTGTKTVACKDMSEAASSLGAILTDEDSLFYDVDFQYTPSYFQDDFSLKANVTLENLLRQNNSGGLPAGEAQALLNQAADAKYTLSLELPGKIVSTNADSQNGQVCIWNLAYGKVTRIELATTNVFSENIQNYQALQDTRSRNILYVAIFGGAAALALIAGLLVFFLRARRKDTAPKGYFSEGNLPPRL